MGNKSGYQDAAKSVSDAMRSLGLNKTELAKRADVDRSHIAKLTVGEPWRISAPILGRIERALEFPPGYIEDVVAGKATPVTSSTDGASSEALQDQVAEFGAEVDALRRELQELRDLVVQILPTTPEHEDPLPANGDPR